MGCNGIAAVEIQSAKTSRLQISAKIENEFPELHGTHFVVVSDDLSLVVYERDSAYAIACGAFLKAILPADGIFDDGNSITLLEVCDAFDATYQHTKETGGIETHDGVRVCFFETQSQHTPPLVGCVFKHVNKNGCEFTCSICWFASKDAAVIAVKSIQKWLDQFFIFEVAHDGESLIEIPVFYGTRSIAIVTVPQKRKLLLSEKCATNEVRRTVLYRTAIAAPVCENDILGWAHYATATFRNPIVIPLYAQQTIEKAGIFKTAIDSVKYAIFGPSANLSRQSRDDLSQGM
jgi:hypothetical protein